MQLRSNCTSHTPCPSQTAPDVNKSCDEDKIGDAPNVETGSDYNVDKNHGIVGDQDGDSDTSSEPVGERCSVATTQPNENAADVIPSNSADQWTDRFERLPLQPLSNSIAFHTFNLAKLVRKLAGGPRTSGSVFMAEPDANGTVHRNLHLVAFQVSVDPFV